TVTLTGQGPAAAHGSSGKIFRTNTSETNFASSNANGPALTAGQQLVSIFALSNTATAAQGSATLNNVTACDTIDTAHILVFPYDGSTGPADANFGGAIHFTSSNGGSFNDASAVVAGFQVFYGDATSAADCTGVTGFYASATDPTFTAGNPIVRVKIVGT